MTPSECYAAGRLADAIKEQTEAVRGAPTDTGKRMFLFELQAFAGDLERARRQLDAVKFEEPAMDLAAQGYRLVLEAEKARRKLFQDGVAPQFFGTPPDHAKLRLDAILRLRENRHAEAKALLEKAAAEAPTVKGQFNGKAFDEMRDADDLFGSVLEVMVRGEYFWVPLEQVAGLGMNPPRYPRDLLWCPARLTLRDGQEGEVFLPALYPGSHEAADETLKLGRATDWKTQPDGPVRGVGCREFLIGEDLVSLLEWRQVMVD